MRCNLLQQYKCFYCPRKFNIRNICKSVYVNSLLLKCSFQDHLDEKEVHVCQYFESFGQDLAVSSANQWILFASLFIHS